MFNKDNRALSFVTVGAVYILAVIIGVLTYVWLPFPMWASLLISDVAATVLVYIFSVVFKNASVYDPYWSVQPPLILVSFAIGSSVGAAGILLIIAVSLWGIRLTANWAYTFKSLNHQDWRYTMLSEKCGAYYWIINFVGIHMVPTLVVYACTLPAATVIDTGAELSLWSIPFFVICIAAALMQGIADIQMHKHRKSGVRAFINTGLWKYSRHPNYLAEIIMWWGVAIFCLLCMPDRFYFLVGAVLNTALFLFVSIPMADGRQSQKPGFSEYKAKTRMLLPIKKFK